MEFDEQKIILPFSLDLNILEQCGSCGISSGNLIAYTLSFDTHYLVFNDCNTFSVFQYNTLSDPKHILAAFLEKHENMYSCLQAKSQNFTKIVNYTFTCLII